MRYWIRNFERVDRALIGRFSKLSTAAVADAMGRFGGMDPAIRGLTREMGLCGPAFTVRTYRADNLFLHVALEAAEPGDVIVADGGGIKNAGIWGDLMTEMAVRKRLGGAVIDGAVRDSADLIESGLPVFSRGVSPMGGYKENPGAAGVSISCGNTPVNPGDLILGDADGIVVVPREDAAGILEKAEQIQQKEASIRARMEQGETLFQILGLSEKVEIEKAGEKR